jgi:hypothetical protein
MLRVGFAHRHTLVDIDVHETEFRVYDQAGESLATIFRTGGRHVTRTKGYGVRDRPASQPLLSPLGLTSASEPSDRMGRDHR